MKKNKNTFKKRLNKYAEKYGVATDGINAMTLSACAASSRVLGAVVAALRSSAYDVHETGIDVSWDVETRIAYQRITDRLYLLQQRLGYH